MEQLPVSDFHLYVEYFKEKRRLELKRRDKLEWYAAGILAAIRNLRRPRHRQLGAKNCLMDFYFPSERKVEKKAPPTVEESKRMWFGLLGIENRPVDVRKRKRT